MNMILVPLLAILTAAERYIRAGGAAGEQNKKV